MYIEIIRTSVVNLEVNMDKKLVSFRLSEDLIHDLRERADRDGISVTELVQRLLRQGLQATMDDRIATLEAEIQELRQVKQLALGGVAPTPVYALLQHGLSNRESNEEVKERIARLESLIEKVITQSGFGLAQVNQDKERISRLEALMEKVIGCSEVEQFQTHYREGGHPDPSENAIPPVSPKSKPASPSDRPLEERSRRSRCDE